VIVELPKEGDEDEEQPEEHEQSSLKVNDPVAVNVRFVQLVPPEHGCADPLTVAVIVTVTGNWEGSVGG